MDHAIGALIAGVTAEALGYSGVIALVAGLTAASGLWVLIDMPAGKAALESTQPIAGQEASELGRVG